MKCILCFILWNSLLMDGPTDIATYRAGIAAKNPKMFHYILYKFCAFLLCCVLCNRNHSFILVLCNYFCIPNLYCYSVFPAWTILPDTHTSAIELTGLMSSKGCCKNNNPFWKFFFSNILSQHQNCKILVPTRHNSWGIIGDIAKTGFQKGIFF
jgi:hypothetical protein